MKLLDLIRSSIIGNTDISKAKLSLPVKPSSGKKCVLGDIMENPENFKLIAYMEGNEVVIRVKPKKGGVIDVTEVNNRQNN